MSVKFPNGDMKLFPADEWDKRYLTVAPNSFPRDRWLFDLDDINLHDLTEPDECEKLETYVLYRTDAALAANIVDQATTIHGASGAMFAAAGVNPFRPPNRDQLEWMAIVLGHLNGVVWRLKWAFNRPRPYHNCKNVGVLAKVDRPAHASYPSGHASTAYTYAGLIGSVRSPADRYKLFKTADEVSRGREIAGVHFPSDTRAGELLARILVKGMLESNHREAAEFKRLTNAFRTPNP